MEHHVESMKYSLNVYTITCTCGWQCWNGGVSFLFDKWHEHKMDSYVDEMEAFLERDSDAATRVDSEDSPPGRGGAER